MKRKIVKVYKVFSHANSHTSFAGVITILSFFGFTSRTSFPTGGFPFPVSLFFKLVFPTDVGLVLLATDFRVGEARHGGANKNSVPTTKHPTPLWHLSQHCTTLRANVLHNSQSASPQGCPSFSLAITTNC